MLEESFISSCQTNNKQTSKTGFEYKHGAAANPMKLKYVIFCNIHTTPSPSHDGGNLSLLFEENQTMAMAVWKGLKFSKPSEAEKVGSPNEEGVTQILFGLMLHFI